MSIQSDVKNQKKFFQDNLELIDPEITKPTINARKKPNNQP